MLAQGGEPTQPGGGGGGGTPIEIQDVWLDREYVYVPSNAGGYIDEFIAQIDRFNDVWYVLQDANFNVLGITDSGGELVEQRTYDPYGELLTRESFTAHPGFKAGHQGLFFDRLEPSPAVGGSVSMGAASQLEPNTFGIYQVRNRVLIPRYGRWAQKDPNASGMLHASLWHDGQSPSPDLAAGSLDAMLGDGSNLFAFVGNSPFNATDPSGLFAGLGGMAFSSFTQGILRGMAWGAGIGGVVGGAAGGVSAALTDGDVWRGIGRGMLVGAAGGAVGGGAGFALAGTGVGVTTGLMGAGGLDGATSAMLDTLLDGGSTSEVAAAGAIGFGLGAVTAGAVDVGAVRVVARARARWGSAVTKASADGNNLMGVMSTTSGKMELDTVPSGVSANGRHRDLAERVGFEPWNDGKIGFSLENMGRHGTFQLRVNSGQVNATNPNLGGNRELPPHVKQQLRGLLQEAFGITIK